MAPSPENQITERSGGWAPRRLPVHPLDRRGQATCGPPVGESEGVDNHWRQWRRRPRRMCGWRWRRWRRCTEKTAACTATSLPTLSSTFAPTLPTTPRSRFAFSTSPPHLDRLHGIRSLRSVSYLRLITWPVRLIDCEAAESGSSQLWLVVVALLLPNPST